MWHGGGHLVAEYELLISLVSEVSKQKRKERKRKDWEGERENPLIYVKGEEGQGEEEF